MVILIIGFKLVTQQTLIPLIGIELNQILFKF